MKPLAPGLALIAWLVAMLGPAPGFAHELRPAYLELRELRDGEFSVLWKTPMRGALRLALWPELSGPVENLTPPAERQTGDAAVHSWRLKALAPLAGQTLRIAGLQGTMTDALVRVEFADGATWVKRLTAVEPAATIPARPSGWGVAAEYFELGVEHILSGIDHLAFVVALLMITRGGWMLVKTVTGFTLAHSITLSAAMLGFVRVPVAPLEAVVALSIVLVAWEITRLRAGRESLTSRAPWAVAFVFGLVHGAAFAGALIEVGIPQAHVPVALLFFNLGVEAGQLLFVAAVLGLAATLRGVASTLPRWAGLVPPYTIGSFAVFWLIERVAAFG